MTATIPVRIGRTGEYTHALVDAEDLQDLSRFNWRLLNGYASAQIDGVRCYMHRYLMQTPDGMDTDHINRDKLDNRRGNLRVVDRSINNHNAPPPRNNTSGYRGVGYFKPAQLWRAYIHHKATSPKRIDLGYFKTKEEAISARRAAEKRLGIRC